MHSITMHNLFKLYNRASISSKMREKLANEMEARVSEEVYVDRDVALHIEDGVITSTLFD